jgi:putative photosynthetic complex assembly protein 2
MNDCALAALFVMAVWWISTVVVLRMVWHGRSKVTLTAFSVLAVGGLVALFITSRLQSTGSAYLAFSSAIVVWGWHELVFLQGIVTGPRRIACPPNVCGWRRFRYATAVVIHHELALAGTLMLIVALTWGRPQQVGTETFTVLWVMRLSAKLNVFLGVRNLTEQFVPHHLAYMLSYFRRARANWLMPLSLLIATAVLVRMAATVPAGSTALVVVGRALVGTILALAVLEHIFLALPVPDASLWQWAIRSKRGPSGVPLRDLRAEAR